MVLICNMMPITETKCITKGTMGSVPWCGRSFLQEGENLPDRFLQSGSPTRPFVSSCLGRSRFLVVTSPFSFDDGHDPQHFREQPGLSPYGASIANHSHFVHNARQAGRRAGIHEDRGRLRRPGPQGGGTRTGSSLLRAFVLGSPAGGGVYHAAPLLFGRRPAERRKGPARKFRTGPSVFTSFRLQPSASSAESVTSGMILLA